MRLAAHILIVLMLLCPLPAAGQQAEGFELPPLERFEELIGVLMTGEERTAWARLRSAGPRRAFVERFWEIRDPTPGTEVNEVQEIFMRRARRAALLFSEGAVPGYATDRGKVLIVYGLPDEQELRALPPGTDSPRLAWRFNELDDPIAFAGADGRFTLGSTEVKLDNQAFVKSVESELRLPLAAVMGSRRRLVTAEPPSRSADGETVTPPPDPTVDVAPEVRIWMQMVFAGTMREQIGLRHRVHYFPASEGTYTVLAFEVDGEDLGYAVPPLLPTALADEDQTAATPAASAPGSRRTDAAPGAITESPLVRRCTTARLVEEGLLPVTALPTPGAGIEFEDDEEDGPRAEDTDRIPSASLKLFGAVLQGEPGGENTLHQFIVPFCVPSPGATVEASVPGREPIEALQGLFRSAAVTLVPGTYRLAWGVYDEVTGRSTTRDEVIEVPDFAAPELSMSSILVARPPHRDDPVTVRADRVYPGIRLGGVLLTDDVERIVGRNETIEVVVIATGWRSDPGAPGKPRLQVGYRILDETGEHASRIPAQILDFHVLGQQIPLRQVDMLEPGGRYLIEVRILDLTSGVEIRRTVPIRVRDTEASDPVR